MEQPVPIKEVKILETAEDIQERREQVLLSFTLFIMLSSSIGIKWKLLFWHSLTMISEF